jgi:hypothetical protein
MALIVYFRTGTAVQSVVDFKYIMAICKEVGIKYETYSIIFTEAAKRGAALLAYFLMIILKHKHI